MTRNTNKLLKTFIPITLDTKEQIGTTLYVEEIEFIRGEKGWLYQDVIREGVKALLEQEKGKTDVLRRIENLENVVYSKKRK